MKAKQQEKPKQQPWIRKYPQYQRNQPCPCGSGKKFKHCCEKSNREILQKQIINYRDNYMKNMKEQILHYLKTDRKFETGARLFLQFGQNHAMARKINIQGYSPRNLEMLHYQLFKLTGEPETLLLEIMKQPVIEPPAPEPEQETEVEPEAGTGQEQGVTVLEATKMKLRAEFPFLSDKSCPDAFKVLVADMLTAYENYIKAHDDLYNVADEKQAFEAADDLIVNYLENRAIWEELEHYKTTGKILGKHTYFEDQNRFKELSAKNHAELIRLRDSLKANISRNLSALKKNPNPALVKEREKKVRNYERDLKFVKTLLNLND